MCVCMYVYVCVYVCVYLHIEMTLTPMTLEALVLKFFGEKRTKCPLKLDQTQA